MWRALRAGRADRAAVERDVTNVRSCWTLSGLSSARRWDAYVVMMLLDFFWLWNGDFLRRKCDIYHCGGGGERVRQRNDV